MRIALKWIICGRVSRSALYSSFQSKCPCSCHALRRSSLHSSSQIKCGCSCPAPSVMLQALHASCSGTHSTTVVDLLFMALCCKGVSECTVTSCAEQITTKHRENLFERLSQRNHRITYHSHPSTASESLAVSEDYKLHRQATVFANHAISTTEEWSPGKPPSSSPRVLHVFRGECPSSEESKGSILLWSIIPILH